VINFARLTAALALAGAILSTPAYAAPLGEARSVAVRTADLNLDSSAGRATLTRRINFAAGVVCGHPDERDLVASRLAKTCHSDALESAMPQVQLALANLKAGRQLAANTVSVTARAF
jgi:UrcA family protein